MNIRFKLLTYIIISLSIIFSGCSTSTISNTIALTSTEKIILSQDKSAIDTYIIGGGGLDWGESAIGSEDGAIFLFGQTRKSFNESTDLLVAKLSDSHKLLWAKTYGGSDKDIIYYAIKSRDDSYLLLCGTQSLFFTPLPGNKPERPLLIKIDKNGDVRWAATFDREMTNVPLQEQFTVGTLYSVIQTSDGGYALVGTSAFISKENEADIVVVKLTENGEQVWQYRYDLGIADIGYDLKEMSDGNLIIVGGTANTPSKSDIVMLKLDSTGHPLWAKSYSAEQSQVAYDLIKSESGHLVISGSTLNSTGETKIVCAKFSTNGDIIWSHIYGSKNIDTPIYILNGHKGEYLIVGRSGDYKSNKQDGLALLLSDNGELITHEYFGGYLNDELRTAYPIGNEEYYLFGTTDSVQETYTNMLSVLWNPEKDKTPKAQKHEILKTPQKFTINTEDVNFSPINYHMSTLSIDTKITGLKVKSLSIAPDSNTATSRQLK